MEDDEVEVLPVDGGGRVDVDGVVAGEGAVGAAAQAAVHGRHVRGEAASEGAADHAQGAEGEKDARLRLGKQSMHNEVSDPRP